MIGVHAHADFRTPLFEVGDWMKNKRGSDNGGLSEQQKALAEQTITIRLNSLDCGIPIRASKKEFELIAQAEIRADQCTHECNVLALTQVIESKQKHVAVLTKLLEISGMDSEQKAKILEKVMQLMEEIKSNENLLRENSQNKRMKCQIVNYLIALFMI